jgi:hypothetical protein
VQFLKLGSQPRENPPILEEVFHMARSKNDDQVTPAKKYDTVVSSGQAALKAFLTMNGGATIAFLAFIGHVIEANAMPSDSVPVFVTAMQFFIAGTFSAVLAYGTIFITNVLSSINWRRSKNVAFAITLLSGLASVACFIIGSLQAVDGFRIANEVLSKRTN